MGGGKRERADERQINGRRKEGKSRRGKDVGVRGQDLAGGWGRGVSGRGPGARRRDTAETTRTGASVGSQTWK